MPTFAGSLAAARRMDVSFSAHVSKMLILCISAITSQLGSVYNFKATRGRVRTPKAIAKWNGVFFMFRTDAFEVRCVFASLSISL
jgi:hypothetical protein